MEYGEPSSSNTRGVGGKLRKEKKHHLHSSTPYDRPKPRLENNNNNNERSGWISRIVTPAKRLISGSATRLLPSFFSSSSNHNPSFSPDERRTVFEEERAEHNESYTSDLVALKPAREVGTSEDKGKSVYSVPENDTLNGAPSRSDDGVPDVEHLIKEKTFSRGEIDRLMNILNSRVPEEEKESKVPTFTALHEVKRGETSHEMQNVPADKGEVDKLEWAASTPLLKPTLSRVQNEIGASPVDIARAYMSSRSSEVGFTSTSLMSRSEKLRLAGEPSTNIFMPSPLPKAPICWPGAMTQDKQGFSTPQSQKSKYARTPYSRTLYTKSKSMLTPLPSASERLTRMSNTSFQPARTPAGFGKSISNVREGSYGSGGPIRRVRNRSATAAPARGTAFLGTAQRAPLSNESAVDVMLKKSFEPRSSGTTYFDTGNSKVQSSDVGVGSVHPHSSKLARQILDQLDRPVTLKEKSEELKLAGSWKNSSLFASATPANNSSQKLWGSTGSRNMNLESSELSALRNGQRDTQSQDKSNNFSGSERGKLSAVDRSSIPDMLLGPSTTALLDLDFPDQGFSKKLPKGNGQPSVVHNKSAPNIANNSAGPETQSAQRKPVLASISVDKSGMRPSFSTDGGAGFTFPVTTSASTSAEPPTPSIMPSFLTSSPDQPKVLSSFPAPSFGNKIMIAPPVISPLSTSTTFTSSEATNPKFKFGSERTRLSFAVAEDSSYVPPNDGGVPKYTFGSGKSRLNFASLGSDAVPC